jgi:excisionase family DNA binding protein
MEQTLRATADIAEAARVLGIHKQTLYDAIKRGEQPFPIIRVGARILVPREALDRLVREGVS